MEDDHTGLLGISVVFNALSQVPELAIGWCVRHSRLSGRAITITSQRRLA